MTIKQQALIAAEPAQVYAVLADAGTLSALSGMSGVPGRSAGEEFSAFDGHVTGRQIELVPGERVVQAWRFPQWAPGTYSVVSFTLTAEAGGTRLVIDQHGVPDDWHDHIDANWPPDVTPPIRMPLGHADLERAIRAQGPVRRKCTLAPSSRFAAATS